MTNETQSTGVEADESLTLGKLAEALAKAQGAMKPASKESTNPYFGSKYADLASVMAAVREPLSANGLAITQRLSNTDDGVLITTMLMHSSGEWMRDRLSVVVEQTVSKDGKKQAWIQAFGSAVTYARRYALSAMLGVAADEDDDGNAAGDSARGGKRPAPQPARQTQQAASSPESLVGKVRFGKKKGVPLADLDNDSLSWYANKIAASTDPADVAMSHDIEAEFERRGVNQANGASAAQ